MRTTIIAATLLAVLAVPASAGAPPSPQAFVSDNSHNYFGYFMPPEKAPVVIGKWTLEMIAIGPPADFRYFAAGKEDPDVPGRPVQPFLVEFIEAHPAANQTAAEIIVQPDSFKFQGATVSFAGHDAKLGNVTFDGTFTAAFLKAAATKAGPSDGPAIVLTGMLSVGTAHIPLRLAWTGGGPD